jgi:hypothetical protein
MALQRWAVRLALDPCRFDEVGLVAGILHRLEPSFDEDDGRFGIEVHVTALIAADARREVHRHLDAAQILKPRIASMVAVRAPLPSPSGQPRYDGVPPVVGSVRLD